MLLASSKDSYDKALVIPLASPPTSPTGLMAWFCHVADGVGLLRLLARSRYHKAKSSLLRSFFIVARKTAPQRESIP